MKEQVGVWERLGKNEKVNDQKFIISIKVFHMLLNSLIIMVHLMGLLDFHKEANLLRQF